MSGIKKGFEKALVRLLLLTKNKSRGAQECQRILEGVSPKPAGTVYAENSILPEYDLHIIIPAYNAEKYVCECMDSILAQETKYSYTITVVDDGSADATVRRLEPYCRDGKIELIRQKNQGAAAARNRALRHMKGKYILFVDADDVLLPGAIDALLDTAYQWDAQAVEGGYLLFWNDGRQEKELHGHANGVSALEADLTGYAAGKAVKAELFAHMQFPEGYGFEDTLWEVLVYPLCSNACMMDKVIYGYRQSEESVSKTTGTKPKCLDTFWVTQMLWRERERRDYPKDVAYCKKLLNQIHLNYQRTWSLSEEAKQCIFELSAQLFFEVFQGEDYGLKGRYRFLILALKRGSFRAYCRLMGLWDIID